MEKSCRERRFTLLPELPGASQLFVHFLTKRGESLVHAEINSWLGELDDSSSRVIIFQWWSHPPSRAHPGQLGQGEIIRACASDVLDNQSVLKRFWLEHKAQRLDVSSHTLAKVDSAERVTVFPETTFLHINEAY